MSSSATDSISLSEFASSSDSTLISLLFFKSKSIGLSETSLLYVTEFGFELSLFSVTFKVSTFSSDFSMTSDEMLMSLSASSAITFGFRFLIRDFFCCAKFASSSNVLA